MKTVAARKAEKLRREKERQKRKEARQEKRALKMEARKDAKIKKVKSRVESGRITASKGKKKVEKIKQRKAFSYFYINLITLRNKLHKTLFR